MQRVALGQAFDRRHLLPRGVARQQQARADRPPVDEHGAGATDPHAAPFHRAAQAQIVAQALEQRLVGFDRQLPLATVDRRRDGNAHADAPFAAASAASTRSGRSGRSWRRTPPSAFVTALPIAAPTGPRAASPTPLAPNGPSGWGVSTRKDWYSCG